ncbi:Uncharacterized protein FKW44_019459, partial [Caligus rogercresseyi]
YTPKGEFHAMDCTDMVIGVARDSTFRIFDYYTRDRSTPQRDTFWGGTDDLNGETVIFFRKKIKSNGFSDHDIVNENMHVIWAMGQESGDYVHHSSVTPSIPNFYMPDEIKYHGKRNRAEYRLQSGTSPRFLWRRMEASSELQPEEKNCDYFARWIYKEGNDEVDFEIQSKFTDKWTGIGFSETPQMSRTDMVIGWVQANGRTSIQDYWANGYFQPAKDSSQDLKNKEGSIDEGGGKVNPNNKRFKNMSLLPSHPRKKSSLSRVAM